MDETRETCVFQLSHISDGTTENSLPFPIIVYILLSFFFLACLDYVETETAFHFIYIMFIQKEVYIVWMSEYSSTTVVLLTITKTLLINHRYHGKCQLTENSFAIFVI